MATEIPSVIDKQCVDIGLKAGINEKDRAETLEWGKFLTTAENVVLEDFGALSIRPAFRAGESSGTGQYRLLALDNGIGTIAPGGILNHMQEVTGAQVEKGRIPEFGVDIQTVSSWGADDNLATLVGCGLTSRYKVLVHRVSGNAIPNVRYVFSFMDRYSGNIVQRYVYSPSLSSCCLRMCIVDNRYMHVYVTGGLITTLAERFFFQTDCDNLPGALGASPVILNSNQPVMDCVAVTGGSVAVHQNGNLQRFTTGAVSAATDTTAGFNSVTGIDTDLTSVYVIGSDATPDYKLRVHLVSTLAVTRTVTDTTAADANGFPRVAVNRATGGCTIVAYNRFLTTVAGVYTPYAEVFTCSSSATTFTLQRRLGGWMEAGLPFYLDQAARTYVPLCKQVSGVTAAAASRDAVSGAVCIVDITEPIDSVEPTTYRPAAVLDNYIGSVDANHVEYGVYNFSTFNYPARSAVDTTGTITYIATHNKISQGAATFDLAELKLYDPKITGGADVFSGSCTWGYDGLRPAELSFIDMPSLFPDTIGAGSVTSGLKNYTAVFEYKDCLGQSHYSRCARVGSITLAGAENVEVQVIVPTVTAHAANISSLTINLYRTATGGTTYYLVQKKTVATTGLSNFIETFTDNVPDAALQLKPQLFRQPGTTNTALDRYYAPASSCCVRHKDRVFTARGSNVYYSSYAVEGEAPWFNPAFYVPVPGGSGNITALASMDGVLVVFKRDAIFLIDGDGPPENGGTGTEFSPPRKILTEFGCADARTVIPIPSGLMYRSQRGIELLSRSLQVGWIGERVKDTVDANPYSGGACFDRSNGWALFPIASAANNVGLLETSGTVLCYDTGADAWTSWKTRNRTYGGGGEGGGGIDTALVIQDVAYAKATSGGSTNAETVYGMSYQDMWGYFTATTGLEVSAGFIDTVVETGWIRGPSAQDRITVTDFYLLGKKLSNHNISVKYATDYSDSYTLLKTITPTFMNALQLEQLHFPVPKQSVQSIRFRIETTVPTNQTAFPIGSGKQLDILALTVKMGLKGGGAQLSTNAKGVT